MFFSWHSYNSLSFYDFIRFSDRIGSDIFCHFATTLSQINRNLQSLVISVVSWKCFIECWSLISQARSTTTNLANKEKSRSDFGIVSFYAVTGVLVRRCLHLRTRSTAGVGMQLHSVSARLLPDGAFQWPLSKNDFLAMLRRIPIYR